MSTSYDDAYRLSLDNPQAFWAKASQDIEWVRRPRMVLNDSDPLRPSWFPGGMLNTCFNAVDLHVLAGRGDQQALVYDSPVTNTVRSFTYHELKDEVSRLAGALQGLGVERGDRVLVKVWRLQRPRRIACNVPPRATRAPRWRRGGAEVARRCLA